MDVAASWLSRLAGVECIMAESDRPDHKWVRYSSPDAPLLVFVHGHDSDELKTWTSGNKGIYWPELILTDRRLSSFDLYVARYHAAATSPNWRIEDAAAELWGRLNRDSEDGLKAPLSRQRVIFVCHSMGGIVLARCLTHQRAKLLNAKRIGLLLIAVPFYGSGYARLAGPAVSLLFRNYTTAQLGTNDPSLRELSNDFRSLIDSVPGIVGAELYEQVGFRIPLSRFFKRVVEPPPIRFMFESQVLAKTTHSSIAKPTTLNHPTHLALVSLVNTYTNLDALTKVSLPFSEHVFEPYRLQNEPGFIGRRRDKVSLTRWLTSPSGPRVVVLRDIGGMGKSALAWNWFQRVGLRSYFKRKVWFSFYGDSSRLSAAPTFDRFVLFALAALSEGDEGEYERLGRSDRIARLLDLLDKVPCLLVLDGAERLLRRYNKLEAGLKELGDDLKSPSAIMRSAVEIEIDTFLRSLSKLKATRVLVTTRVLPFAFETSRRTVRVGVRDVSLRGLDLEDTAALWSASGCTGSLHSIRTLHRFCGGHPLSIRTLGGHIAACPRSRGDLDSWLSRNVLRLHGHSLVSRTTHVLRVATADLGVGEREVLKVLALIRAPISFKSLLTFTVPRALSSRVEVENAVSSLEERGLIGWDYRSETHDLHPFVQQVVWESLGTTERSEIKPTLEALAFVDSEETTDSPNLGRLDALSALFEIAIGDRRLTEAWELLFNRMSAYLHFGRGGLHNEARLLTDLIDALRVGQPTDIAYPLTCLSRANALSGRAQQALTAVVESNVLFMTLPDAERWEAVRRANVAFCQLRLGRLGKAALGWSYAIRSLKKQGDLFRHAVALRNIGEVSRLLGRIGPAKKQLARAIAVFDDLAQPSFASGAWATLALCELDDDRLEHAGSAITKARQLNPNVHWRDNIRVDRIEGTYLIAMGRHGSAELLLRKAAVEAARVGWAEEEFYASMRLVDVGVAIGQHTQALKAVNAVIEQARESPYPIVLADAWNAKGRLQLKKGKADAARRSARLAHKYSTLDGDEHSYAFGLSSAHELLTAAERLSLSQIVK